LTFSILSEKSHHFLNIIEKRETLIIISHVILVTLDFNKFLPNYNHKYENVGMPLFIKTLCGQLDKRVNSQHRGFQPTIIQIGLKIASFVSFKSTL